MKFLKKIILFGIISVLFANCKKEELPQNNTTAQPVFSFNGNINGTSISLQAGINNYYMYSTYSQDSVGIYGFTGTLQSTATNKNSIQIIINDKESSPLNGSVTAHIDSALSIPYYGYSTPNDSATKYLIKFTPSIHTGAPTSYLYNFGDGNTSNATSPTHTYSTPGTYNTSLTVHFASGNVSMSNTITILSTQPQIWLDSIVSTASAITPPTAQVRFFANAQNGASPYTYKWNYGDATTYNPPPSNNDSMTVEHVYDSIYKVYYPSLTVTDRNNHSETYNYSVYVGDTIGQNVVNYTMSPPVLNKIVSYPFSDVIVNYIDGTGHIYTSNNSLQPGNSNFDIVSVSPYQNNLNNNPTKMLNVTFNCWLYPILGGTAIQATSCTAIIAVAYH